MSKLYHVLVVVSLGHCLLNLYLLLILVLAGMVRSWKGIGVSSACLITSWHLWLLLSPGAKCNGPVAMSVLALAVYWVFAWRVMWRFAIWRLS